ncbi:U4/U6.U5 tri-snRNP-associated protein 2 [Porphyridium purpureum]|uniref:U4/U6.U5 tri-snRNP-associated protein 2 n=1 Tax=Porphyridium purpureum TaxID=35688 RepID=A0A5J4YY75_PORPP|nr:U4/U6.U5 tri-snRNP-associated protein 2 [Porphyridium purpureum]|eukprot:POR2819..scf209_3
MESEEEELQLNNNVNRAALDFDTAAVCSVTLSVRGVYMCLKCGKTLAGLGTSSPAYLHSLERAHHLFVQVGSGDGAIYALPQGSRISAASASKLDDVIDEARISCGLGLKEAHVNAICARSLSSKEASPAVKRWDGERHAHGVMVLDVLHTGNYFNCVVLALVSVPEVRNLLLRYRVSSNGFSSINTAEHEQDRQVLQALAVLVQKMWLVNPLKTHRSPAELANAVSRASGKRFAPVGFAVASDFLCWLLAVLDRTIATDEPQAQHREPEERRAAKRSRPLPASCMSQWFRGVLLCDEQRTDSSIQPAKATNHQIPFWMLSVDMMDTQDVDQASVHLSDLLRKYNGKTRSVRFTRLSTGEKTEVPCTFSLLRSPRFLVIHVNRLLKTAFGYSMRTTHVSFPLHNLQLLELSSASPVMYGLRSIISHRGESVKTGSYVVHILHEPTELWYNVSGPVPFRVLPELVSMEQAHILLYERCA